MKVFRLLTRTLVTFCAVVAACAFVLVIVLTFVVSGFRDVTISGWNVLGSQVARWFLFWAGIYVVHNTLPIAIAHGRTRREFLSAATGFSVVLAVAMSLIVWVGFVVEGGIYSAMGWKADPHGSVVAYFLMFLVWCAVGMFCAAAFDRFGAAGVFSVPVGLMLVMVTTAGIPGAGNLPFVPDLPSLMGAGWHLVSVVAFAGAVLGTWVVARDMPVRVRTL
ncbi:hypothetical protein [Lentzea aerocolonigenes]|uniref:hypothetical protein n=1 Tax=Lentzea aerocolonigenes TaxID=68170 RepID=UPI00075129E0|nr:hypothetical protein [Lentzea aerocolonigenes]MCP2245107.1 hypothetical protein [Lentzea aerocolonigenes]